MARRKPLETGICQFCRKPFTKHRSWARFCPGTSCSDKYRRRKKAAHPILAPSMPSDCEAVVTASDGRKHREESDDYAAVVIQLNATLRVIKGRCGLQWIAQKKERTARWTSFAFCATREGLLLRIREHLQPRDAKEILPMEEIAKYCDPEAWVVIEALPDYYPK